MRVENRLIVCYIYTESAPFEAAWRALRRLHEQYGDRLFLHQFGVRPVDGPSIIEECRLLALVFRERDFRAVEAEVLACLTGALRASGAEFYRAVPERLSVWIADLTEWREGKGPEPQCPDGLALVEPAQSRSTPLPSPLPSVRTPHPMFNPDAYDRDKEFI